jgi:hypothetical protein
VLYTSGTKVVLYAALKTNCCPRASTMSRKGYVRTEEEPNDRTDRVEMLDKFDR